MASVGTPIRTTVPRHVVDGRMTLTSGTAITIGTVTSSTLYFTPLVGGQIGLYDGSRWRLREFTETSVAVPSTRWLPFDVFIYDNAGTITLDCTNWTDTTGTITGATNAAPVVITSAAHGLSNNDFVRIYDVGGNTQANGPWAIANKTADTFELVGSTGSGAYTAGGTWRKLNVSRATALTTQNGIYVKSGATSRRWLGTCCTNDTSGSCTDGIARRFVSNYYNTAHRSIYVSDGNSHTYTSATERRYRGQASAIDFVLCDTQDFETTVGGEIANSADNITGYIGSGMDDSVAIRPRVGNLNQYKISAGAVLFWTKPLGVHFAFPGQAGGTTTTFSWAEIEGGILG